MTMVVWPHRENRLMELTRARRGNARAEARVASYRVIMAGGGTGGHLYPGLAVAGALQQQLGDVELIWAATPRPVDQRLLSKFGDKYIRQPVQPLVKQISKLWGFWTGWRQSCRFWEAYLNENKAHCVVALGGYAAGPAAYVAHGRGIPVVLLNPDALPGRANRFLLKRADVIVTQWALAHAPEDIQKRVKVLGCPIRGELVGVERRAAAEKLGVPADCRTLVVTGASLGARTINDAVVALLKDEQLRKAFSDSPNADCLLPLEKDPAARPAPAWQIIHLAGMDQAEQVRAAYAAYPSLRVKVMDYCDDMASLWAVADLAVARAGASTCAELTACGVPSILLPYPYHKDMHQKANALELSREGAAVVLDDARDAGANAAAIKKVLDSLLYDDAKRNEMAVRARAAGKPDAAENIAREILTLIGANSR